MRLLIPNALPHWSRLQLASLMLLFSDSILFSLLQGIHRALMCMSLPVLCVQGDVLKLVDDIGELKPSLFIGVPRVFDRIYTRIMDQVRTSSNHTDCKESHYLVNGQWDLACYAWYAKDYMFPAWQAQAHPISADTGVMHGWHLPLLHVTSACVKSKWHPHASTPCGSMNRVHM